MTANRTHTAEVLACAVFRVSVTIPAGLSLEEEARVAEEEIRKAIGIPAVRIEWEWTGPLPSAWFMWREAMWATDGSCAIREGCPIPAGPDIGGEIPAWRTDVTADMMGHVMESIGRPMDDPAPRHVHERYIPLIRWGTRIVFLEWGDHAIVVYRGLDLVAVVMPTRRDVAGKGIVYLVHPDGRIEEVSK